MKYMLHLVICIASLWPRLSSAYDYDIATGNVMVSNSDPYNIYGTSTVNTITVKTDVAVANVTISNLNIQVTNRFLSAFSVASNATLNLTLLGSNFLTSGRYKAAVEVPAGATLNITNGDAIGMLTAMGGGNGAGIGSAKNKASGRILINGGHISAVGGPGGAGIGCGDNGGNGGVITIAGGTVVAQGGGLGENGCGAGIGGGNASAGGTITITGGKVTATGGTGDWPYLCGSGIGGGTYAPGGLISISGGTVFATRGHTNAQDIGAGSSTTNIGTNGFFSGSIKTSANAIWSAPVGVESHAAYLLIVSNAVDGTNNISISLTNMQTRIPYLYKGAGHGNGDRNLYFYLPAGDYPTDSTNTLGFFVNADGTSGSMSNDPSDWTEDQRSISTLYNSGTINLLVLARPLGRYADNFYIEGADTVEENGWNWRIIPYSTEETAYIYIYTNAPSLMLRVHY